MRGRRRMLQQNDIFAHEWHRMRRVHVCQVVQHRKMMRYACHYFDNAWNCMKCSKRY